MKSLSRRQALGVLTIGAASTNLSKPALSQNIQQLTMVTSWPKSSPGPGWSADRIAKDIADLSDGKIQIKLYAAGALVPALQVFDAVSQGNADLGHSASFFWAGKMKASVFYTTIPFGFTPIEHQAWLAHHGGNDLWRELYAPFGVIPFAAGNSGMQMGGWFKKPINNRDDLNGLKMRVPGLGGAVMQKFGVQPVLIPPAEIFSSLRSNLIDGAEFLGPWSDQAFGFHQAAPYYYGPSFNEPNGNGELIVNHNKFQSLSPQQQKIIAHVALLENNRALQETRWYNSLSFAQLQQNNNLTIAKWSDDIVQRAKQYANEILDDYAGDDDMTQKILSSYRDAMQKMQGWSAFNEAQFGAWRNKI